MPNDNEINPMASVADESITLIDEQTVLPKATPTREDNATTTTMLNRKTLTQIRLMRWFAFILSIGTCIIIWRYASILILAIWLSSICRPLLEWLVNHL